jgi:3-hydroxyisobutyrate dehydrogenase
MDIGFIGVGQMGGPMARRLLNAGHRLVICDVSPDACARLVAQGAESRSTPSQVAADCPTIITSLPSPKEVEIVMRGTDGLLSSVRSDTMVLETSTIGPALSRPWRSNSRRPAPCTSIVPSAMACKRHRRAR